MNKVELTRLRIASLSVFRGILTRSVPRAFYRLLSSLDKPPEQFLECYGEFYSLISERGCSDKLAYAMTEAALFDENCFTRAAAGGTYRELPEDVLHAVRRDCEAILSAAELSADEVISAYPHAEELLAVTDSLPRWKCGECAESFRMFDGSLDNVAAYYRKNGCGMFARYKAFVWRDGDIRPVLNYDTISLDEFTGYESQRDKVVANTKAFLEGKSCNNCLLFGDMGTGKSSTVKAVANAFRADGLRIVEIPKERLTQDRSYTTLKAVLEGGLAARPRNALIYATSNRRHIVKEKLSDRAFEIDDVNTRDNMQETLSLSDRFGLTVCYTVPKKSEFLEIVAAMAKEKGINISEAELFAGAERFALVKGGRSPRCAKQYVESLYT